MLLHNGKNRAFWLPYTAVGDAPSEFIYLSIRGVIISNNEAQEDAKENR